MVPDTDDGGDAGSRAGDSPGSGGPGVDADAGDTPAVESRWWYWVAAVPLYWVASSVLGFAFGLVAFAFALTGAGIGHMGGMPGLGFGFGALGFVGLALVLVAAGLVLSLAFPVAVYLDAEAVAEAGGEWQPDPALYGLVGLAGVIAQPLQVPLAVYYLYKRHESVGRP
jgi:hypothetical protein